MLHTFFYLSESRIDLSAESPEIIELVEQSRVRNAKRRISGALIFTDRYFVQAIEGPADEIDALKNKIIADPRHSQIVILADGPTDKRQFGLWSLAYSGTDTLIDDKLAPALAIAGNPERDRAIRSLKLLLTASVEQNGWVGPTIDTALD